MMNLKRIARRAASWQRSQVRKRIRAEENAARAENNRTLRALGLMTPHEEQRAKRKTARDQLRIAGLLPPIGMTRKEWNDSKKGQS